MRRAGQLERLFLFVSGTVKKGKQMNNLTLYWLEKEAAPGMFGTIGKKLSRIADIQSGAAQKRMGQAITRRGQKGGYYDQILNKKVNEANAYWNSPFDEARRMEEVASLRGPSAKQNYTNQSRDLDQYDALKSKKNPLVQKMLGMRLVP